jgi:hypothetical protein
MNLHLNGQETQQTDDGTQWFLPFLGWDAAIAGKHAKQLIMYHTHVGDKNLIWFGSKT